MEPELRLPRRNVEGDIRYFNVVRRGARFTLLLLGGDEMDITARRGDLAWLTSGDQRALAPTGASTAREAAPRPAPIPEVARFFAELRGGALVPLDPVGLPDGARLLVAARVADAVPATPALRRILARGGPDDLPPDFARNHDYYAHRGPRR